MSTENVDFDIIELNDDGDTLPGSRIKDPIHNYSACFFRKLRTYSSNPVLI